MLAQAGPLVDLTGGSPSLYVVASVGNLFLAIVVIFRARQLRGALPLALLCLSLFIWDVGEAAVARLPTVYWNYMPLVGSAMAPAFLFHFILYFVRREEEYRRLLGLLYGVTGLFAILTAGAIFWEALRPFVDDKLWNLIFLVALFPFLILSLLLTARRLREVEDRTERNALNLIGIGIAIGAFTGFADLTVILGSPLPRLGHLGSLACTIILAVAIFRHRLLQMEIPFRSVNLILGVAAVAVIMIFLLYTQTEGTGDLLIFGTVAVTVLLLAVYRLFFLDWYVQQEQNKRLVLLGTMAAGVAHEIKNPLASIKGAAQLLTKEVEGRLEGGEGREYLKMLVEEADRLNEVVEHFLDFARPISLKTQMVDIAQLLDEVVTLQRAAAQAPDGQGRGSRIELVSDGTGILTGDPAFLRHAFVNLVKNAVEAAGSIGRVRVTVRPVRGRNSGVSVDIEDDGPGIPEAQREEIFQPFMTTKTRGTGLGLPIARRIVEAHGGKIEARNLIPHGACFTVHLPSGPGQATS